MSADEPDLGRLPSPEAVGLGRLLLAEVRRSGAPALSRVVDPAGKPLREMVDELAGRVMDDVTVAMVDVVEALDAGGEVELALAALERELDAERCRACGCTNWAACAEGCAWVAADLCSACVERPAELRVCEVVFVWGGVRYVAESQPHAVEVWRVLDDGARVAVGRVEPGAWSGADADARVMLFAVEATRGAIAGLLRGLIYDSRSHFEAVSEWLAGGDGDEGADGSTDGEGGEG